MAWKRGDVGIGQGYERAHYEDFTSSLRTASGRFVVHTPRWKGEHPLVVSWFDGEPFPDLEEEGIEYSDGWCPEDRAEKVSAPGPTVAGSRR